MLCTAQGRVAAHIKITWAKSQGQWERRLPRSIFHKVRDPVRRAAEAQDTRCVLDGSPSVNRIRGSRTRRFDLMATACLTACMQPSPRRCTVALRAIINFNPRHKTVQSRHYGDGAEVISFSFLLLFTFHRDFPLNSHFIQSSMFILCFGFLLHTIYQRLYQRHRVL